VDLADSQQLDDYLEINKEQNIQRSQTIEILATGPGLEQLGPALLTSDFVEQAGMPADLEGLLSLTPNEVAALPAPNVVQLFELRTTDAREANEFDVETSDWPASPGACPFHFTSRLAHAIPFSQLVIHA
jgi:hypothetical protein